MSNNSGGGINQSLLDRIDSLESESQILKVELDQAMRELQELKSTRATQNTYGLSKISSSSSVTTDDGLVLSAKEKNASIDGTIANGQKKLQQDFKALFNSALKTHDKDVHNSTDALESGIYNVFLPSGDIPVDYGVLVSFRSANGYLIQVLKGVVPGDGRFYIRTFDNNISWSAWRYIDLAG